MASIYDASTTAASNTSLAGINIAENCPASGINDAIRELVAETKGAVVSGTATGTDTYAATLAPTPTALTDGMTVQIRFTNANTSATPTLNINSLGGKTITKNGGAALVAGDIPAAHDGVLRYVLSSTTWQLLNPKKVASSDVTGFLAVGRGLQSGGSATGNLDRSELVNAQTGTTYTVLTGDGGKLLTFTNASAIAVTLPQTTSTPGNFPAGWYADFECLSGSTGAVTITPTTSTIDGAATLVLQPGACARVVSDGTNYQVARGFSPSTKAQMQTGTDAKTTVTPARVSDHDAVPKLVGSVSSAGASLKSLGQNTFTPARNSAGNYTITFGTAFTDANYVVNVTVLAAAARVYVLTAKSTTAFSIQVSDVATTAQDNNFDFAVWGRV